MGSFVCMLLFLFKILLLCDGRQLGDSNGILKTIKTSDGEVIDCVDMYKQLSLAHPLLLNHTIQLEPSFETNSSLSSQDGMIKQNWHNYGQCPHGTIPILRKSSLFMNFDPSNSVNQLAVVKYNGNIHGGHARVNIWKPSVSRGDASLSRISISAGSGSDLKTIQIGWRVVSSTSSGNPTTFIYRSDKSRSCYNLDCPGFVQTGRKIALGAKFNHISAYNGVQYDVQYDLRLDERTKNWWVSVNGSPQGYWPSKLFSGTFQNGDEIQWGGEVIVNGNTATQMGSGHISDEGDKKACYMADIKVIRDNGKLIALTADDMEPLDGGSLRYKVSIFEPDDQPPTVYFGGPGGQ